MKKTLLYITILILIAVFITVIVRLFIIELYDYESDSMCKTIVSGKKVLISKVSVPKKNDIVLCQSDTSDHIFLSRMVAVENDLVQIIDQDLFVQNKSVAFKNQIKHYCLRFFSEEELINYKKSYKIEPYNGSGFYTIYLTNKEYEEIKQDSLSGLSMRIAHFSKCCNKIFEEVQLEFNYHISEDSVFILNDNRSNLHDSRTIGVIHEDQIIGKLIYSF